MKSLTNDFLYHRDVYKSALGASHKKIQFLSQNRNNTLMAIISILKGSFAAGGTLISYEGGKTLKLRKTRYSVIQPARSVAVLQFVIGGVKRDFLFNRRQLTRLVHLLVVDSRLRFVILSQIRSPDFTYV